MYLTPGPSELYPTVASHIADDLKNNVCSLSHRGKEFEKIFARTVSTIKALLEIPEKYHIFFTGCATEWMERLLENCVAKSSFHFVNGAFSERFFEMSRELKKQPTKYEAEFGTGFTCADAEIPDSAELICFTHNETSSGVAVPLKDIYAVRKKFPNALIALDVVSSVPFIRVDYAHVDAAFFSVQKGFGMPAGLGVLLVNNRCIEKARTIEAEGASTGTYHSFSSLLAKSIKNQTPETPNVLGISVLGKVCEDMQERGIERIRRETAQKARMLYDFLDTSAVFTALVKNKAHRSNTIIVFTAQGGGIIKKAIAVLASENLIAGTGYGKYEDAHIRIGNFPAHRVEVMERVVDVLKKIA